MLAQILPISFTQNLFSLALLLSPSRAQKSRDTEWYPSRILVQGSLLLTYTAAVTVAAPLLADSQPDRFMPCILLIRVTLAAPYALLRPGRDKRGTFTQSKALKKDVLIDGYIWCFVVLAALSAAVTVTLNRQPAAGVFRSLWESGPAVKAIGYDFVIGVVSSVAMLWIVICRGD